MIFISLAKLRRKPTKDGIAEVDKLAGKMSKYGIKVIGSYWTLGRYDSVLILEAPDEKVAMKGALLYGDIVSSETLVAVPRNEAVKLLD